MGRMIDGEWTTQWYPSDADGRFQREETRFHDRITADGSSGFPPVVGRYHLYVSAACPWAHRTLIVRALKGLDDAIGVTVVDPRMGEGGWHFSDEAGCDPDPIHGARYLREVYKASDDTYTGRVTVPLLWDRERGTIVNNESRQIIRMFDHEMNAIARNPDVDLCPPRLAGRVDEVIDAIYEPINNGVYRAGFAKSQKAYNEAVHDLFTALRHWNDVLADQRFLCGDVMTEADICLFTTLYRFDAVYYTHFKCNMHHIWELPNLWRLLLDVLDTPGVRQTCDLDHVRIHYFWSHDGINPQRIIPHGPIKAIEELFHAGRAD